MQALAEEEESSVVSSTVTTTTTTITTNANPEESSAGVDGKIPSFTHFVSELDSLDTNKLQIQQPRQKTPSPSAPPQKFATFSQPQPLMTSTSKGNILLNNSIPPLDTGNAILERKPKVPSKEEQQEAQQQDLEEKKNLEEQILNKNKKRLQQIEQLEKQPKLQQQQPQSPQIQIPMDPISSFPNDLAIESSLFSALLVEQKDFSQEPLKPFPENQNVEELPLPDEEALGDEDEEEKQKKESFLNVEEEIGSKGGNLYPTVLDPELEFQISFVGIVNKRASVIKTSSSSQKNELSRANDNNFAEKKPEIQENEEDFFDYDPKTELERHLKLSSSQEKPKPNMIASAPSFSTLFPNVSQQQFLQQAEMINRAAKLQQQPPISRQKSPISEQKMQPQAELMFASPQQQELQQTMTEEVLQSQIMGIKLQPFIQTDAKVGYLNDFLINENQILSEIGRKEETSSHFFFSLIYAYYVSLNKKFDAKLRVSNLKVSEKSLFENVFSFKTQQYISPACVCGDGQTVTGTVQAQLAERNPTVLNDLNKNLQISRDGFYNKTVPLAFQAEFKRLRVERYLEDIFLQPLFFSKNPNSDITISFEIRTENEKRIIEDLRNCITCLFYFEDLCTENEEKFKTQFPQAGSVNLKQMPPNSANKIQKANNLIDTDTPDVFWNVFSASDAKPGVPSGSVFERSSEFYQFKQDIRKWIINSIAHLLQIASVDDHRFIIFECIRCHGIGKWGADFIQISNISSDVSIDFFIASLSVFLTPIRKENDPNQASEDLVLSEEDYLELWKQFPCLEAVMYLFFTSKLNSYSKFQSWEASFSVLETILYILKDSLNKFNIPTHKNFARQIGRTIVIYVQTIHSILCETFLGVPSSSENHANNLDFSKISNEAMFSPEVFQRLIVPLYNNFFLLTFFSIFRSVNLKLGLWMFLVNLPWESPCLTDVTFAVIFWSIFTNNKALEFPDLCFGVFASFDSWQLYMDQKKTISTFDPTSPNSNQVQVKKGIENNEAALRIQGELNLPARRAFYTLMVNLSESFYLLPVLEKCALSTTNFQLSIIIMFEMFLLGFVEKSTRELYHKTIVHFLGSICHKFPQLCSLVLRLVVKFFRYVGKGAVHIFQQMPIHEWVPSEEDLHIIGTLLQTPLESTEFSLGLIIIENLRWTNSLFSEESSSSPLEIRAPIQRKLLLMIANSYVEKRKKYSQSSASSSFFSSVSSVFRAQESNNFPKFEQIMLKIVLQTTFYDDGGFPLRIPILKPTDLQLQPLYNSCKSCNSYSNFDTVSAFILFNFGSVGSSIKDFKEYGAHAWLAFLNDAKEFPILSRIIIDLSIRMLPLIEDFEKAFLELNFVPYLQSIISGSISNSNPRSFLGISFSGMKQTVFDCVKSFSEAVAQSIEKLANYNYRISQSWNGNAAQMSPKNENMNPMDDKNPYSELLTKSKIPTPENLAFFWISTLKKAIPNYGKDVNALHFLNCIFRSLFFCSIKYYNNSQSNPNQFARLTMNSFFPTLTKLSDSLFDDSSFPSLSFGYARAAKLFFEKNPFPGNVFGNSKSTFFKNTTIQPQNDYFSNFPYLVFYSFLYLDKKEFEPRSQHAKNLCTSFLDSITNKSGPTACKIEKVIPSSTLGRQLTIYRVLGYALYYSDLIMSNKSQSADTAPLATSSLSPNNTNRSVAVVNDLSGSVFQALGPPLAEETVNFVDGEQETMVSVLPKAVEPLVVYFWQLFFALLFENNFIIPESPEAATSTTLGSGLFHFGVLFLNSLKGGKGILIEIGNILSKLSVFYRAKAENLMSPLQTPQSPQQQAADPLKKLQILRKFQLEYGILAELYQGMNLWIQELIANMNYNENNGLSNFNFSAGRVLFGNLFSMQALSEPKFLRSFVDSIIIEKTNKILISKLWTNVFLETDYETYNERYRKKQLIAIYANGAQPEKKKLMTIDSNSSSSVVTPTKKTAFSQDREFFFEKNERKGAKNLIVEWKSVFGVPKVMNLNVNPDYVIDIHPFFNPEPQIDLEFLSKIQFQDQLLHHTQLDTHFLSMIANLFENRHTITKLNLSCWKGSFCKNPGVVAFQHLHAEKNKPIEMSIAQNRNTVNGMYNHSLASIPGRVMTTFNSQNK